MIFSGMRYKRKQRTDQLITCARYVPLCTPLIETMIFSAILNFQCDIQWQCLYKRKQDTDQLIGCTRYSVLSSTWQSPHVITALTDCIKRKQVQLRRCFLHLISVSIIVIERHTYVKTNRRQFGYYSCGQNICTPEIPSRFHLHS